MHLFPSVTTKTLSDLHWIDYKTFLLDIGIDKLGFYWRFLESSSLCFKPLK